MTRFFDQFKEIENKKLVHTLFHINLCFSTLGPFRPEAPPNLYKKVQIWRLILNLKKVEKYSRKIFLLLFSIFSSKKRGEMVNDKICYKNLQRNYNR